MVRLDLGQQAGVGVVSPLALVVSDAAFEALEVGVVGIEVVAGEVATRPRGGRRDVRRIDGHPIFVRVRLIGMMKRIGRRPVDEPNGIVTPYAGFGLGNDLQHVKPARTRSPLLIRRREVLPVNGAKAGVRQVVFGDEQWVPLDPDRPRNQPGRHVGRVRAVSAPSDAR